MIHSCIKVPVAQSCLILLTPWTVACQALLSREFSTPEYWSGLPFPSSGDHPDPGIEPRSPALQADSLSSEPPGKSIYFSKLCWSVNKLNRQRRPTLPHVASFSDHKPIQWQRWFLQPDSPTSTPVMPRLLMLINRQHLMFSFSPWIRIGCLTIARFFNT